MKPPRVFVLTLAAKPDSDPYIGIRHILKLALRRYGLRCIDVREVHPPAVEEPAEPRP